MKTEEQTSNWYTEYYAEKGILRNDIFQRDVLFQHLAYEKCWIEAHRNIPRHSKILDVGGGNGSGIIRYLQAGFSPDGLCMVDILEDRVAEARSKLPAGCNVQCGDASNLGIFKDSYFDVVTSSTMFIQLTDEKLAREIGREMIRVLADNGRLMIFDWRYDFWRSEYEAVNPQRLARIFGANIQIQTVTKGQLLPPLGRFLSKYCPSLYFLCQKVPYLSGLVCYEILIKAS